MRGKTERVLRHAVRRSAAGMSILAIALSAAAGSAQAQIVFDVSYPEDLMVRLAESRQPFDADRVGILVMAAPADAELRQEARLAPFIILFDREEGR